MVSMRNAAVKAAKRPALKEDFQANEAAGERSKDDSLVMHDVAVNLSGALRLGAVADIVANYCRKNLDSPAGMMFVERGGGLQTVSQWRTGQIRYNQFQEDLIRRGPVAQAFRTGQTVLWNRNRTPQTKVSRVLHHLLGRWRCRSFAFLPLSAPDQPPNGVLAIVLRDPDRISVRVYDELFRLAQLISGCIARARAYDEAMAAREEAEHAVRSKDEFLSVLSHELKNPMMPIMGWAVALSSGTLPEDKQTLALEGIVRNIKALNYLIEDLFDTARITSGKLRLQLSEVRIQDIAREAMAAIQNAVETKKLRIATDISEAIPPFVADSRRLHQVLVNLLNNAVKFTPASGSIALQIRRRGHCVECVVEDNGKGIERDFLPFVFERFKQENRPSKTHTPGLGLGLAIVREIVELHGGSIAASSDGTDKGATFVLRLPLRRRHARAALRPQPGTETQRVVGKKI
jgi:signal transduction histidine kinase